ncbi:MAG: DnaJ domain-containing protein, partial [Acidimicrobiaceae bacterium]|nr:DnaJ domain-containing protein [Acidimicrobiaceae bacterium]
MAVQAEWLERDLYAVLGVAEDADSKTISRAYRKLARELHPDTHPDDPGAAERFKD